MPMFDIGWNPHAVSGLDFLRFFSKMGFLIFIFIGYVFRWRIFFLDFRVGLDINVVYRCYREKIFGGETV